MAKQVLSSLKEDCDNKPSSRLCIRAERCWGIHLEGVDTRQSSRVLDKALIQKDVSILYTAQRYFVFNLAGAQSLGSLAHYEGIHLQPDYTTAL